MILKAIQVRNFRCILDGLLTCDQLTVLVGPNGSGKSSFLHAIDTFYSPMPRVVAEDFYAGDTACDISIKVTFTDLTSDQGELFKLYMQGDELTVERVVSLRDGRTLGKYYGSRQQNRDFNEVREAESAQNKKAAYEVLRRREPYRGLPVWSNQAAATRTLSEWEAQHPEALVWQRDDGQFFGFSEVAQGYLGRFTRFLLVPAVRDANDDATEGKGSVLSEIMNLVVRNALADSEEIRRLREQIQQQYDEILGPSRLTELQSLELKLSDVLQAYAPHARVQLLWAPESSVDLPLPAARVKLIEDGYAASVNRTGHGLQRAFILTMLQHLALTRGEADSQGKREEDGSEIHAIASSVPATPNLIVAIEEPELYQHPSRQRHLSKVLRKLASGGIKGVADRTQILYSTHSPLFVGLDRFDQIRLLRKANTSEEKPNHTQLFQTTLDEIAGDIWIADGRPPSRYTAVTLRPRLSAVMNPSVNEGFFADAVVLVEGESDRAAVLGMALSMGFDLESDGYAVIGCGGKSALDRPIAIFQRLGIPVYAIWDGDKNGTDSRPEENHRLLRLLNEPEEDYPSTKATDHFACFETKLDEILRDEIGREFFERSLSEWQSESGISRKNQALKNPECLHWVIEQAKRANKTCATLQTIVEKVRALQANHNGPIVSKSPHSVQA